MSAPLLTAKEFAHDRDEAYTRWAPESLVYKRVATLDAALAALRALDAHRPGEPHPGAEHAAILILARETS